MVKVDMVHCLAMSQQISEAVSIKLASNAEYKLLNFKTEYNRCVLPEQSVNFGQNKQSEVEEYKEDDEAYFGRGRSAEEENQGELRQKKKVWNLGTPLKIKQIPVD